MERAMSDLSSVPVMRRAITIFMTSIGNEAIHGFVDDLRKRAPRWRLVGVDVRDGAAGLARCDEGYLVPRRDDPRFLPTVVELCRHVGADLFFPFSTWDQDFFSRPEVRAQIDLPCVVSSTGAVAAANGKLSLFAAMSAHEELLPEHSVVRDPDEALEALENLVKHHGAALLKTDRGAGGSGMLCVGRPERDPAPVPGRRWLRLNEVLDILARETGDWPRQAVAWLPGDEYSVDVLGDEGELLGGVVRKRSAAIGGLATEAVTVDEPDVLDAAEVVLRELSLSYVNNIQFRRDAAGQPRLMEINPRIPGTICLTVESGLDLPLAACCLAMGERLPLPEPEIGVRVLRYAGAAFTRVHYRPFDGTKRAESFEAGEVRTPTRRSSVKEDAASDAGVALLWDLDRTLVRFDVPLEDVGKWKTRLRRRFEPLGWTHGFSPLLPSLEAALDFVAHERSPAESFRLRQKTYEDLDEWELAALRGVTPIERGLRRLVACAELDLPMALVTNNGPSVTTRGLETIADWGEAHDAPALGGLVTVHRHPLLRAKPSSAPLGAALSALERRAATPFSLVAVIGDSPHDEAAALALERVSSTEVVFVEASDGELRTSDEGRRCLRSFPWLEARLL